MSAPALTPPTELLPFRSAPDDWRGYTEVPTGAAAAALIAGESTGAETPMVFLHLAAVATFAVAAQVKESEAFLLMGSGTLRYLRNNPTLLTDGTAIDVSLAGASQLWFCLARVEGVYLVHHRIYSPGVE